MEEIARGSSLQFRISYLEIDPPALTIETWVQAVTHIQGRLEVLVDDSEFLIEQQFTFLELVDAFQRELVDTGFRKPYRFESSNDDVPAQLQVLPLGDGLWKINAAHQCAHSRAVVHRAELEKALSRFKEQSLTQVKIALNVALSQLEGRPVWAE